MILKRKKSYDKKRHLNFDFSLGVKCPISETNDGIDQRH